jgi:hypothetical protein
VLAAAIASAATAPTIAPSSAAAVGATPTGSPSRPAPSRDAVLAAFKSASRPAMTAVASAPALAAAVALPTPIAAPPPPALAIAPMASAPLARVKTATSAPPNGQPAEKPAAAPDLDALADYVLERLRNELRDGRERLGFLLDDSF